MRWIGCQLHQCNSNYRFTCYSIIFTQVRDPRFPEKISSGQGDVEVWEGLEYVEHKPPVCPRSRDQDTQDDNLLPSASASYISTGSVWDCEDDCDDLRDVTKQSGNQVNIHEQLSFS